MVSRFDRQLEKEIHIPVNACLTPVCSMHGLAVTTVEGIGSTKSSLHPVQERIAKAHGSQCGFCTPGFVMSMYTLLRQKSKPKMKDLEATFQGNLCRCTGYRPIIEGYKTFTEEWEVQQILSSPSFECVKAEKCCQLLKNENGLPSCAEIEKKFLFDVNSNLDSPNIKTKNKLFNSEEWMPYHPTQEPIFPPELKLNEKYDKEFLRFGGQGTIPFWFRPTNLSQILTLKMHYPDARIVVGSTEIGVETKFKNMYYSVYIYAGYIPELCNITQTERGVRIGASTTIEDVQLYLKKIIDEQPKTKTRIFQQIINMIQWFAGKQIRSVGCIGGNIMTGSPISDIIPVLLAVGTKMEICSSSEGTRWLVLDDNFYTGYRQTCLLPSEILLAIHIPFSQEGQYIKAYKQSKRKEDDIAIVNLALNVKFENSPNYVISHIHLGVGGMSFKAVSAPQTEAKLKGLRWSKDTLDLALDCLVKEFTLEENAPGGMVTYRKSLVLSLFFRAFLDIGEEIKAFKLANEETSAAKELKFTQDYKSSQYFQVNSNGYDDALQKPIVHTSAFKQATGESIYVDDIPRFEGELYLAFVTSKRAYAKVLSIDFLDALAVKGVVGTVCSQDITTKANNIGLVTKDEHIFYNDEVTCQGQIMGAVLAVDQHTAQKAAGLVKVEYSDLSPVILTIEEAIKHKSFFAAKLHSEIENGDVDRVFIEAKNVIEGECYIGGQKHFYMETQSFIAVPLGEDNEMDIYISSQNPTEIQEVVSKTLGVSQNKINVKVKRLGGGFGGKEWRTTITCLPAAIAAKKFNKPIRCMLDRHEDMLIVGGRNPFLVKYKAAFDNNGKILAADYIIYLNAGCSIDFSSLVLEHAITNLANAFNIQTIRAKGILCRTNILSNTAMRGFGLPQMSYAITCMADDISVYLNKDLSEISKLNLYEEGNTTYYGQKLVNCTLAKCWEECLNLSRYKETRESTEEFNRQNKYKKRGLAIVPNSHGIGIEEVYMNQGAALVNVYVDGSVLLHHGGVEMGQGLYTKMIQITTRVLGVPVDRIHTNSTSTFVVPNTTGTAASLGSDWYGGAVLDACNKIKSRLQPFKEANPHGTWEEWVKSAYLSRVSLSATGFYFTPDIDYDWEKKKGNMYNYFTYGVGCSEVEIDTLTGDHRIIRTNIVMDIGQSLNPAIDIGQIEGAFMQGYGLYTMEEQLFTPNGQLVTRGPGNYKIPTLGNLPGEFNVSLLKGSSNPRAVYSSKALGEPPLFLSCSVVFAIKDAIRSARKDHDASEIFRLDSPATPERIRLACNDSILAMIPCAAVETKPCWSISI